MPSGDMNAAGVRAAIGTPLGAGGGGFERTGIGFKGRINPFKLVDLVEHGFPDGMVWICWLPYHGQRDWVRQKK